MTSKGRIEELIERHQRISDRAYMSYQESGMQRYMTKHEAEEELLDIFRLVYNAADDHAALGTAKAYITDWCSKANAILHHASPDDPDTLKLLRDMSTVGTMLYDVNNPWR